MRHSTPTIEQQPLAKAIWQVSLAVYSQPGIKAACLALQSDYRVRVGVLLALMGLPLFGHRALLMAEMADVLTRANAWQTAVIEPLRGVRNQLKAAAPVEIDAGAQALRSQVLGNEIEAERQQQVLVVIDYCRVIHTALDEAEPTANVANALADSGLNASRYFDSINALAAAQSQAYAQLLEAFGQAHTPGRLA